MKRGVLIGFISVAILLVLVVLRRAALTFVHAQSTMEAPHIGEGGLPQFEKDITWPRVPAKWKMGFGTAVAIDADDNVWVLSRPRTLVHSRSTAPDLTSTAAPPVMEFDNEGNFIQGWGGESGPGYQWPSNEHAITVDYKGFVWIMGNADGTRNNPAHLPNDNQILKFTKTGKFVMAIGKSGQTANSAVFYLDNLPTGKYSVVLLDANSPQARTMFSLILQQEGTDWKIGGLYIKSAQVAGHDSDWFLARAREYKTKGQLHNAWFFFTQARLLISPLPFMGTLATDKIADEMQSSQPADLPVGKTVDLPAGAATYKLVSIFPQAVGNDLDLIVKYQSADISNTNLAYQGNVNVIKAVATKYPEVRDAFAAVVARAVDPQGRDYGTLLAMKDIK